MKRIFSVLVVVMTFVATFSLVSCSKEESTPESSLAGTTWSLDASILQQSYYFVDATKVQQITTAMGQTVTIDGTYTYKQPAVTIVLSYQGETATLSATISGDKLIFSEGGQETVYTKK